MSRVVVYVPSYSPKHAMLLRSFAKGIPGAEVRDLANVVPCDVGVIFGLVKQSYPPTLAKQKVIENSRRLIVMESAFVNRGNYHAIGWNGIHGNADFRSEGVSLDRWLRMKIPVQQWRNLSDGYVLVCGQLPRDTNVQHTKHTEWCRKTVQYYIDRGIPVRFRPHPRCTHIAEYKVDPNYLDTNKKIAESLKGALCTVIWNSTSGVDSVIAGVPVIVCSPDALVAAWALRDQLDPKFLIYPDRESLFAKIGYAQWTTEEMVRGLPWRHLNRL